MTNTLVRAAFIVNERGKDYGAVSEDFGRTAKMWSGILGITVTPAQFALCMMAVKQSRLINTPGHMDSLDDICGYAWCYEQLLKGEKDENQLNLKLEGKKDGCDAGHAAADACGCYHCATNRLYRTAVRDAGT